MYSLGNWRTVRISVLCAEHTEDTRRRATLMGVRIQTLNPCVLLETKKWEPSTRGYNGATLFLGDINTGAWSSRLGESRMKDLRFSRRWLWRMVSSGMLRRVALVRTDVSEERSASFIRMTRIGELRTTLALTSNRRTLRRNNNWDRKLEWNSKWRIHKEE
jgi:hypothetical protein